jgi:hypothetical protein
MNVSIAAMESVKQWLSSRGIATQSDGAGGLSFEAARGDCLVEVDPAGLIRCQFGIDLDELRDLIAGSATEDLGEDELVRAARYHLQTLAKPYAARFAKEQFVEEYEVTDAYAVISYTHPIEVSRVDTVVPVLSRCLAILGP